MTSLLHARPLELNKELNPANADATMRALEHTKLQSDILPIIKSFLFFTPEEWLARKSWIEVIKTLRNSVRIQINRYGCGHWIFYFNKSNHGAALQNEEEHLQLQMIHCLKCGGYDHPWRGVTCEKVRCLCEPSYASSSQRW
jgi:hypothetical protein